MIPLFKDVGGRLYGPAMTDWSAITEAIAVAVGGDQARGRELMAACWEGTTLLDAAQRCVLAHYLADVQETLEDEVAWDEAALVAFVQVAETDLEPVGIASAGALEPSLRLNLETATDVKVASKRPRSRSMPVNRLLACCLTTATRR